MKTYLSTRRRKFYSIVEAANAQTSEWLTAALMNPGSYQSPLATLACLRVLAYRDRSSGLPYPQRKKAIRKKISELSTAPIY